jgi:hypothetical protein
MLDEAKLYTLLKQFEARLNALEDSVNNTLIGGLKEAANTYIDNENYGIFGDKYGAAIDEVAPDLAIINGEDFDARRSLYDKVKGMDGYGSEGFDEEAVVMATIDELKNKLNAIRGVKNEVPVEGEAAEESVEVPSEEQLMAELKG